uniref:Leucine-rich repeat-containing N-terminal plant-type domain-containing protein n=1 Tax=Quercus lobata TaxID=97700 RepID=A0A7N2LK94_QUELO
MKLHNPYFPALCSTFLHIILLFTVTLLCLQPATSTTLTNETDRLALLKFKESIVDDPYGILSSWNDSIQFCNWYGVTCGRCHQRITALELQGHNSLGGEIPASLANCTKLRVMTIAWNKLIGTIPRELGSLSKLLYFRVATNNLTGGIPPFLGNLSFLKKNFGIL